MVKMILALPKKVDVEKLTNLVMDTIKGRYGKNSTYGDVEFAFRNILVPYKSANVYAAGFSGKARQRYYETDAEELDPVMISTLEEFLEMIEGADYSFVFNEKFLARDWWLPSREFTVIRNRSRYYDDIDAEKMADEYHETLELIDPSYKSPTFLKGFEDYMSRKN